MPGDNSETPQKDAFAALQLSKIIRGQDKAASATGDLRNIFKNAEAKGIHLKAAKRAISAMRSDKLPEIMAEEEAFFLYIQVLGISLTKSQLDLFVYEDDRVPGVEKARKLGRLSALGGNGEGENPYDTTSPQGQAWIEAHRNGVVERSLVVKHDAKTGDQTLEKGNKDKPKPEAKADKPGPGATTKAAAKASDAALAKSKAATSVPKIKGAQAGEADAFAGDNDKPSVATSAPNPNKPDGGNVATFPGSRSVN